MSEFTPISKHQLNPDEPDMAVAVYVESTGDDDEFLFLMPDGDGDKGIALSPQEAVNLRRVIEQWLAFVPRTIRP